MSGLTSAPVQVGMPCPRCRVDLVMSDRQGIETDYCPKCRGVWLDRGELDKIIERNAQYSAAPVSELQPTNVPAQSPWVPQGPPPPGYAPPAWGQGYDPGQQSGHDGYGRGHGGDNHGGGHGGRGGGHNSFLGRLFG